jgi:hypothetical protein
VSGVHLSIRPYLCSNSTTAEIRAQTEQMARFAQFLILFCALTTGVSALGGSDHCDSPHPGLWICTFANGTQDMKYEWGDKADCVAGCHSYDHPESVIQPLTARTETWQGNCGAPCVCVGEGVGGGCADFKQGNTTSTRSLKACEEACDSVIGCNGVNFLHYSQTKGKSVCTFLNCTDTAHPKTEPAFDTFECYTRTGRNESL